MKIWGEIQICYQTGLENGNKEEFNVVTVTERKLERKFGNKIGTIIGETYKYVSINEGEIFLGSLVAKIWDEIQIRYRRDNMEMVTKGNLMW